MQQKQSLFKFKYDDHITHKHTCTICTAYDCIIEKVDKC